MPDPNQPILSFDQVTFAYDPSDPIVMRDISFAIKPHTFTAIVGASGGGKSTLLRLAIGLEKPVSGTVTNNARARMIFQDAALLPWRTVRQNVHLGFTGLKTTKRERDKRIHAELESLGMLEFADCYPRDLSGGQRQRAGIARALVSDPELLLLDEPFSALDFDTTARLSQELLDIFAARNITLLMVSHNIDDVILLADEVFVFSDRSIAHKVHIPLPRPRKREDEHVERLVREVKGFIRSKIVVSKS